MLRLSIFTLTTVASVLACQSADADCGGPTYTSPLVYRHHATQIFFPGCPQATPVARSAYSSIAVGDIVNGERVVSVGPLITGVPTTSYQVGEQVSSGSVEGALNQIQSDLQAIKTRLGI